MKELLRYAGGKPWPINCKSCGKTEELEKIANEIKAKLE